MSQPSAIISNRAWLPVEELGSARLRLRDQLTIYPRSTSPHNPDPPPIHLYDEESMPGYFGVPREYFHQRTRGRFYPVMDVTEGREINFASSIRLRPLQIEPVNAIVNGFRTGARLGAILQMPPGAGKTVSALKIVEKIGKSTIVLLHKEFLVNQWRERIEQFLPNARVGIVQQDKCEVEDKDIVLCMMQSLSSRRYSEKLYKFPGLLITDECHRCSSPTFHKAVTCFGPRYMLGLSATPRRKDMTENVFFWTLGPVTAKVEKSELTPKVKRIKTGIKLAPNARTAPDAVVNRILAHSTKRNAQIISTLMQAAKAGRKIIVFSVLKKHLLFLSQGLKAVDKSISFDFYTGSWYDPIALREGNEKQRKRTQRELDNAATKQVIFATYSMAREGLDIPDIDTVFLALPQTDVEQAVGRILRYHPDKKEPIIVDFLDECNARTKRMAASRLKLYQRLGALKILLS